VLAVAAVALERLPVRVVVQGVVVLERLLAV